MNISEQWLREWANPDIDTHTLVEQLTMAGLEVEGIEPACSQFTGVITAVVESVEKHPDADRLSICQVNTGAEKLTIVCGAKNVREGLKVALAPIGAVLPGDFKIKATKLKGVLSEGMLCSTQELGLSEEADGLMELPEDTELNIDLQTLLHADDTIIELSLTPNRGDCLSILGVAREISVINNCDLITESIEPVREESKQVREVIVKEPAACPKYIGQVVEDVDVSVSSPLWLTEKLRRCGIRSINPVVDITNFVMLELGQPMHAFDNDKLQGAITVRNAKPGESLDLLDGNKTELSEDTLLITDDSGPLAIAGVMGGEDSGVVRETNNIFLESAFFNPQAIIGKARQYGLHTDSSHRFERGVDFEIQKQAVNRAAQLITQICGGKPGPVIEQISNDDLPVQNQLELRHEQIKRLLGIELDKPEITRILNSLGMQAEEIENGWSITSPTFRFDIAIEADLVEEIARVYGYNNIETQLPLTHLQMHKDNHLHSHTKKLRQLLTNRGFQEVITYSFVDAKLQETLNPSAKALPLANPIASELSVMRTSLLPGLITTLVYNQKRQQPRIRLFETGLIFKNEAEFEQIPVFAGIISGNINKNHWDTKDRLSDLFDLKKEVETLLSLNYPNESVKFTPAQFSALHPGQSSEIVLNNQCVGYIGAIHPSVQKQLGLTKEAFFFELELNNISEHLVAKYSEISKFPSIRRDLSITVAEEVSVAEIFELIGKSASDVLYNLELFDVYRGEAIDLEKKSLALGLTFQRTSSTLTDDEVESVVGEILENLRKNFGATLRE